METLMADISKVCTEGFSPYCHKVFLKLIPDKSIRVLLIEINQTMHASQKANIRNVDRTNVQVHWQDCILPSSSEYTMLLVSSCSQVLQCNSNTRPTCNSIFPYLSNEVCANSPENQ